jgi:hypothetical protein
MIREAAAIVIVLAGGLYAIGTIVGPQPPPEREPRRAQSQMDCLDLKPQQASWDCLVELKDRRSMERHLRELNRRD